jgi:glucokinase
MMFDLVGDIGATNARFAIVDENGNISSARTYALDDHPGIGEAIDVYLAEERPGKALGRAVLAVAAPMLGDRVTLTNHPWTFSIEELRRRFRLVQLEVINDFAANALAVPHLAGADRIQVGGGAPTREAPVGVIGPGTGLGVSALVPTDCGAIPIQGEGGHVTMAAANARESAVLDLMRKRYDHVSAERVLSGPGLVNLYYALCELSGLPAASLEPAQITAPSIASQDPCAREATQMFCAMLGSVAGNLALTLGARGGVFIAGGIAPKLGASFIESAFRERFEAKGRLRPYLEAIPTYVVTRPLPALLGAAKLLQAMAPASEASKRL